MMLVIIFEQIFLLYFDAGGRSLLIGDHLENCWLATSNSCVNFNSNLILEKFLTVESNLKKDKNFFYYLRKVWPKIKIEIRCSPKRKKVFTMI